MSAIRWFMGIVLGCSLSLLPQEGFAAKFEIFARSLLISGEIVKGDFDKFKYLIESNSGLRIDLNSEGGSVIEALAIGELIQTRRLATNVPNGATCASACVTILAGGVIRTAHPNSKIGIHMASGVFNEKYVNYTEEVIKKYGVEATPILASMFEELAAEIIMKQVYFILKAGISLRLLEATASVSHLDIYWMDRSDSISVNLINFNEYP